MLDNVHALALSQGTVPELRRKPKRAPGPRALIDTRAVPRAAVQAALGLAGGDSSRLTFLPDGTVLVNNHPRPAQRTRESPR